MAFIECAPSVSVATSIFSFLQPNYTYNRQDGVANIPISREIIEDGRTQVTYNTLDLNAKNKKVSWALSALCLHHVLYETLNKTGI